MPSIQKQISLIFNKKKQQIFVDYFTRFLITLKSIKIILLIILI